MMFLKDYREAAGYFTGKVSEVNRALSFSGIAIIWAFKKEVEVGLGIESFLLLPLLFIMSALLFDLVHYIVSALLWTRFHRKQESVNFPEDQALKAPRYISNISYLIFSLKILLNVVGFGFLLGRIYRYYF